MSADVTLSIDGHTLHLKPGVPVEIHSRCIACAGTVTVKAELTSEPSVDFGAFHSKPHCRWFLKTAPLQVIEAVGGTIVAGGPQ